MARILKGYRIYCPQDSGINFNYEENGSTFLENSFGKAMALYKITKKRIIADDSGLCVPALNNAPGVYSARYGISKEGETLSAARKNQLILEQMQNIKERKAYFVCCMVLILSEYRFFIAQETLQGTIAHEPAGNGGFGYDPIFYVPGFKKTVAELEDKQKDRISHRGKAARVIKHYLEDT